MDQFCKEEVIRCFGNICHFLFPIFQYSENADDRGYLELVISEGHMRLWLAEIGKQLSSLKRDNRWADLIQAMLKKEYEISTSIFDFHPK